MHGFAAAKALQLRACTRLSDGDTHQNDDRLHLRPERGKAILAVLDDMEAGMKKRKRKYRSDSDVAFQYYELLRSVLRDLENVDSLIPHESARSSHNLEGEAAAIIDHRKVALLGMIQIICRDHIHWGARLLSGGWTAEMQNKKQSLGNGDHRKWVRENCVG